MAVKVVLKPKATLAPLGSTRRRKTKKLGVGSFYQHTARSPGS